MGATLLAAGLVVTASVITDLAYALLDPRVRYS
jgi:ABC-type dipeptide/oligopeptide/nickel transport system permease component